MITLNVELGARRYPIYIGSGLLHKRDILDPFVRGRDVLIVSNEIVAPLYMQPVKAMLASSRLQTLVLADGEATKQIATLMQIYDALVEHRFGRDCVLIALGGGVIAGILGFAAATWQRVASCSSRR